MPEYIFYVNFLVSKTCNENEIWATCAKNFKWFLESVVENFCLINHGQSSFFSWPAWGWGFGTQITHPGVDFLDHDLFYNLKKFTSRSI